MSVIKLSIFKKINSLRSFFPSEIIYLLIFCFFLAISWRAFQSHIFTIHFVDEDENIIAGYYMNQGEKLYRDIFSHKQPLPAVLSMAVQKVTNPNSLYLLTKRHRELIFFYSAIWTMILIWQFGLAALIFGVSFEFSKQFLLGNLFLGESLAIFPAVYVMGFLWKHHQNFDKPPTLEKFLFSFSLTLLLLSLFALIPFVAFVFLAFVLVFFVDYLKYLENTLTAIQTQYWGATVNQGLTKIILYSLFRPLTNLVVAGKGDFGNFIWSLSLVYLISFTYLAIFKKNLRKILLLSFVLLGISSLRYIEPSATFYNGFHGLPWLGLILWTTIWQIGQIWQDGSLKRIGIIAVVAYLCFLGRFFINDYYRTSDRETDWYVHFSQLRDNGLTIKKLAEPGDKILVMPVEQLIYWESGLGHATRFLYGYEWLFTNTYYKKEIASELGKDPPAFIYYDRASMGKDAWSIFDKFVDNYIRIRREGQEMPLFVRKDKIKRNEDNFKL